MEWTTLCWAILLLANANWAYHCDRTPEKIQKPKNINDIDRYMIEISGNPTSYVPDERYTINLKANPNQLGNNRFSHFTLVVEQQGSSESTSSSSTGRFELLDPMLTRFSTKCRNTVIQTNSLLKPSVKVSWRAPPAGSGCVYIRATVVETPDNWFQDDGPLTKELCEEMSENEDLPPPILKRCCACQEAKYEIAFQGMWSRNTHPKDFPTDIWTTKFGDMIGASHKLHKSFWNYGDKASDGLKLLAEEGDSKSLESELKEMSDDIRTIIKMRELSYPNITGTSYTVFRVDKENHLVSLVSKITPSPDWIVGVSNLELCNQNCTWVESRTLNLYPWDVGTDYGMSYDSADEPALSPQPIRRIKANSPNDERSPFYSEEGDSIKPLAKLHLTRQKLYEKICENENGVDYDEVEDENCATSDWIDWSPCTEMCFKFRMRTYLSPDVAGQCHKRLVEQKPCKGPAKCKHTVEEADESEDDAKCQLSDWGEWSSCSSNCGKGTKTRERTYQNAAYEGYCSSKKDAESLQENEECRGSGSDCEDYVEPDESNCPSTSWGEWTPCNATCGTGHKWRFRVMDGEGNEGEDDETDNGNQCKFMETVECYKQECQEGEESANPFGEIDTSSQVATTTPFVIVSEGPDGSVVDCKTSKWSVWTPCNATEPCKKGYKFQYRHIKIHAQNGGKPCPKRLLKKRLCKVPCKGDRIADRESNGENPTGDSDNDLNPTWGSAQNNDKVKIDCEMGPWSAWSPCSTICGSAAIQQRTRSVQVYPSKNGQRCPSRIQQKKCPLPLSCSDSRLIPMYR